MRAALPLALFMTGCATMPSGQAHLAPVRIALAPESVEQRLLSGPPQTAGMRSGRVVLAPGAAMHRHSTEENEEVLLFLQGQVRVVLGSEPLVMEAGQVLYIPPQTEHELHNEGAEEARYIYLVAPVRR